MYLLAFVSVISIFANKNRRAGDFCLVIFCGLRMRKLALKALHDTDLFELDVFQNVVGDAAFVQSYLAHGIAFAHRHRAVVLRVEIDRYAVRRADFVLAAIALANRARDRKSVV